MSVTAPARRRYTYQEYLAFERTANVRHEFLSGEIYAMAGGTREHAALCANVLTALGGLLQGKRCQAHSSDLRVRVLATGLATYPDVTVVCDAAELDPEDKNAVVNPTLLVEVTSESTEDYDRGEKFDHYKRIPRVREIVFVSHRERAIEVFTRQPDGSWLRTEGRAGQRAPLQSIDGQLVVDDVYRDALTGKFLA
jgi:Uma2 family endonuclease